MFPEGRVPLAEHHWRPYEHFPLLQPLLLRGLVGGADPGQGLSN